MGRKYVIKLKGIDCYLKSTSGASSNLTFDHTKAKVFTESEKMDLIGKLRSGEYKPGKNGYKTDFIRLTMDKRTWQEMYDEHLVPSLLYHFIFSTSIGAFYNVRVTGSTVFVDGDTGKCRSPDGRCCNAGSQRTSCLRFRLRIYNVRRRPGSG